MQMQRAIRFASGTVAEVAAEVDGRPLHLDEDFVVGHDGWALGQQAGAGVSWALGCWGGRQVMVDGA